MHWWQLILIAASGRLLADFITTYRRHIQLGTAKACHVAAIIFLALASLVESGGTLMLRGRQHPDKIALRGESKSPLLVFVA
jgi:hypothetical protein